MAPESVSTVILAPPDPVVKLSSFSGVHWLAFVGGRAQLVRDRPAEGRHREVRAEAGGEDEVHRAAHRSTRQGGPAGEPRLEAHAARRPSRARRARTSRRTRSSCPLTVEASSSPRASRTVTVPFTDSALMRPSPSSPPPRRSRSAGPRPSRPRYWVIEPFTVSADTVPVTPATVIVASKPSIARGCPPGR